MRIAIVTESFLPTVNGVSNTVARVSEQLERLGHQVLIVAPGRGPDRFGGARVVRTPSIPLPGYQSIPVGMPTATVLGEVEAFAPRVIHVGGPVALGAWGLSVARRLDVPAVALYQTDFPRFARHYKVAAAEGLAWRWLRRIHSLAQLTLAPSSAAAWDLRRNGVPRVRIWARGVDTVRFHPGHRDEALRRSLASDGQVLIGYIGRLAPEKNVGLLQRAAAVRGARLVVVGDGPDRDGLQQRLPQAVFTGYKGGAELSRLFASLDVFVHTGAHETFCQTIQESLASGVPVVAPATGGPLDLIRHGHNGMLYRPGDGRALRRALRRLVERPDERRSLATAARPGVAGRTWETLADELLDHYRAAMARHDRTSAAAGRPAAAAGTHR